MSGDAKSRMDRIIRLHEEIDSIKADIREVYAEEKADGGDKTAMGAAISIIRKREKDRTAFDDREAMVDVCLNAYASPSHTHAREGQSYAEVKGVNAGSSSGRIAEFDSADAGSNPAPVITEHEQPETATQSVQPQAVGSAPAESASDEISAADASKAETMAGFASAPITNPPAPSSQDTADKTGEVVPPPSSPVGLSDADVPAFLKKGKTDKPDCLKLKDGHCRINFATSALCSECNSARSKARAGA